MIMVNNKFKFSFKPERSWTWLMASFLILTAAAFVGGYLLYRHLATIEDVSRHRLESQDSSALRLDLKALEQVHQSLQAKAARREAAKTNPPNLPDPSL